MTATWNDHKQVDPGRKGGIFGIPAAPVPLPPRRKLLDEAEANGWRWEVVSGPCDKFVHEDGATLYVNFRRSVTSGMLHPTGEHGVSLTPKEVHEVIHGTRCSCPFVTPPRGLAYLQPLDDCELSHEPERAIARALDRAEAVSG